MKIAIVAASPVPFVIGGAENLWAGWLAALNQRSGVQAELIKLPSPERNFWEIVGSYRRFAELDLLHFDRVISTKYPAWMVSHPDHHVFLQHKLRGLYDTWPAQLSTALPANPPPLVARLLQALALAQGQRQALGDIFACLAELQAAATGAGDLPPGLFALPGPLLRQVVHTLDDIGLARLAIRRYAAISATVAGRSGYFPADVAVATEVEVIHHPTLPRTASTQPLGKVPAGCIFTASRLDGPKRMDWVVQAYLKARPGFPASVPLVIAGDGPQRRHLETLTQGQPDVHLVGRLTDDELAQAYQQALFVPFVPDREDYGLITLEALQAGKPVLTCADAGGVTELVHNGVNGLVTAPTVDALAEGMRQLVAQPALLQQMAGAAAASVAHIQWHTLAEAFCRPYPRVAVVNTFPVFPPRAGGQMRMWQLYSELARKADVRLVNLSHGAASHRSRSLAAGLHEVVAPASADHLAYENSLTPTLKASCTDVAAMQQPGLNPLWLQEIAAACAWGDLVIASHPYAYPAIRQASGGDGGGKWNGAVVYESANVELDLKSAIFPHADEVLQAVRQVEGDCARQAPLVLCCSGEDAERMAHLYTLGNTPKVVPNGVDIRAYPVCSPADRQALRERLGLQEVPVALYVGSLHGPNVDALLALLPVAAACPDVMFVAVGSVCNAAAVQAASLPPNLRLLGRLSDAELRVWLAAADVGLNPMVSGSGTNLKMLEYAAAGLPILSTPFGGRGGLLTAPDHYLAADMAGFAAVLQTLLQPDQTAERTARALRARAQTEAVGDWRVIAAGMWRHLQGLLPQHTATQPCSQT